MGTHLSARLETRYGEGERPGPENLERNAVAAFHFVLDFVTLARQNLLASFGSGEHLRKTGPAALRGEPVWKEFMHHIAREESCEGVSRCSLFNCAEIIPRGNKISRRLG